MYHIFELFMTTSLEKDTICLQFLWLVVSWRETENLNEPFLFHINYSNRGEEEEEKKKKRE